MVYVSGCEKCGEESSADVTLVVKTKNKKKVRKTKHFAEFTYDGRVTPLLRAYFSAKYNNVANTTSKQ